MSRRRTLVGSLAVTAALVVTAAATAVNGGLGAAPAAADVGTLATSPGCGRTPTLTSGTHTISSGGMNRTFILRIPANYNNTTPYRLILGFHWLNGTANDVATGGSSGASWAYYGMQEQARETAILVAPQGLNNGWANTGGQDITFVDNLISRIENDLCVDTSLRFALGFSYGGAMSYSLACSRPNVFRAVAVFAGAQLSGCSGGTQPVAYFGIHGISDNVLNISMGRSLRDTFVRNNGCTPQNPREPSPGSLTHITTVYSGCREGYPVQWAAFDGGHQASPMDGAPGDNGARTWTKTEVWRFFSQFAGTSPTTPPTTPPVGPTTPPVIPTTPPVIPTTPPVSGGCSATVASLDQWPGGFVISVRVTAGSSGTNGWAVTLTLPAGSSVTNTWNATASGTSGTIRFTSVSYNGRLGPGQTTDFGFQGVGTGSGVTPTCTAL